MVDRAKQASVEAIRADKIKGATKLVEPEVIPGDAVYEEVGILRRSQWQPNERDQRVIETLADIEEVKPNRSYYYRAVQKDIEKSAKSVDNMILSQNKPIDTSLLKEDLLGAINGFKEDLYSAYAPDY